MRLYSFSQNSDMNYYRIYYQNKLNGKYDDSWSILISHGIKSFYLLLRHLLTKNSNLLCMVHDQVPHPNMKYPIIFILNILVCLCATKIVIFSKPAGVFKYFSGKVERWTLPDLMEGRSAIQLFEKNQIDLLAGIDRYILLCGRYDYYKLHPDFIANFKRIRRSLERTGLELVIVGRGWKNSPLAKHAPLLDSYVDDVLLFSLIKHSESVLLPYSSASQSGFYSLIRHFDKSIVMTKIPTLEEQYEQHAHKTKFVDNWNTYEF